MVIAYVAIPRFGSEMRFSISTLHEATLVGCLKEREARVLMAANFKVAFGELRHSCRTNVRSHSERKRMMCQEDSPAIAFVSC